MRLIAEFEKTGRCIWFSHLDLQRTMQRALRRSRAPIAYSQGFNPHAELAFASALPLGCRSRCEIMDVKLDGEMDAGDFLRAMNAVLPEGLRLSRARTVDDRFPAPMAKMAFAVYEARPEGKIEGIKEKAEEFLRAESFFVEKQSKGKSRELDIRPLVHELQADGELLRLRVTCTNADNLRPELLLSALFPQLPFEVTRVGLLQAGGEPLFELKAGEEG